MKRFLIGGMFVVLSATVFLASYAVAGGGDRDFAARLSGYQEVPAVSTSGRGRFHARLSRDEETLRFVLRYSRLEAPATAAHIHFGQRFVAGGVAAFLCGGGPTSKPPCPAGTGDETVTVSGSITAADVVGPEGQGISPGEFDELLRALRHEVTYVNVHSSLFPTGEIRGQVRD